MADGSVASGETQKPRRFKLVRPPPIGTAAVTETAVSKGTAVSEANSLISKETACGLISKDVTVVEDKNRANATAKSTIQDLNAKICLLKPGTKDGVGANSERQFIARRDKNVGDAGQAERCENKGDSLDTRGGKGLPQIVVDEVLQGFVAKKLEKIEKENELTLPETVSPSNEMMLSLQKTKLSSKDISSASKEKRFPSKGNQSISEEKMSTSEVKRSTSKEKRSTSKGKRSSKEKRSASKEKTSTLKEKRSSSRSSKASRKRKHSKNKHDKKHKSSSKQKKVDHKSDGIECYDSAGGSLDSTDIDEKDIESWKKWKLSKDQIDSSLEHVSSDIEPVLPAGHSLDLHASKIDADGLNLCDDTSICLELKEEGSSSQSVNSMETSEVGKARLDVLSEKNNVEVVVNNLVCKKSKSSDDDLKTLDSVMMQDSLKKSHVHATKSRSRLTSYRMLDGGIESGDGTELRHKSKKLKTSGHSSSTVSIGSKATAKGIEDGSNAVMKTYKVDSVFKRLGSVPELSGDRLSRSRRKSDCRLKQDSSKTKSCRRASSSGGLGNDLHPTDDADDSANGIRQRLIKLSKKSHPMEGWDSDKSHERRSDDCRGMRFEEEPEFYLPSDEFDTSEKKNENYLRRNSLESSNCRSSRKSELYRSSSPASKDHERHRKSKKHKKHSSKKHKQHKSEGSPTEEAVDMNELTLNSIGLRSEQFLYRYHSIFSDISSDSQDEEHWYNAVDPNSNDENSIPSSDSSDDEFRPMVIRKEDNDDVTDLFERKVHAGANAPALNAKTIEDKATLDESDIITDPSSVNQEISNLQQIDRKNKESLCAVLEESLPLTDDIQSKPTEDNAGPSTEEFRSLTKAVDDDEMTFKVPTALPPVSLQRKSALKLGLKISDTSAAFISSGVKYENDPKKRNREEGIVIY